jgi:hypothetical protein
LNSNPRSPRPQPELPKTAQIVNSVKERIFSIEFVISQQINNSFISCFEVLPPPVIIHPSKGASGKRREAAKITFRRLGFFSFVKFLFFTSRIHVSS